MAAHMASNQATDKSMGVSLTAEVARLLEALKEKFPDMNQSAIIRKAIRELAKREKVA